MYVFIYLNLSVLFTLFLTGLRNQVKFAPYPVVIFSSKGAALDIGEYYVLWWLLSEPHGFVSSA